LSLHVLHCYFPCVASFAIIFARSLLSLPQHIPLCHHPCMHVFIVTFSHYLCAVSFVLFTQPVF
jgi:hypothetical protein